MFINSLPALFISIISSSICLSLQILQKNFLVSVSLCPNSKFLLQIVQCFHQQ